VSTELPIQMFQSKLDSTAYEYAWTGRIASGVYYYTVEAERAGKKLKAKGKFAVVR